MKELLEKIKSVEDSTECSNFILDYIDKQMSLYNTLPDQRDIIIETCYKFLEELLLLNIDKQNYYNVLTWLVFTQNIELFNDIIKKYRTFLKLDK